MAKRTKTAVQILKAAKKILETKGWTRLLYAKDARGESTNPVGRTAAKFCAIGALYRAAGHDCFQVYRAPDVVSEARLQLGLAAGNLSVADWNDAQKSKRPVIAAFKKAIALAEGA